ncbi:MAG: hypothetical protein ACLUQ6_10145 [Alistipes onderdonkii]
MKIAVKNLFNEEYLSVLARPMPRLNFEIFLDIRPKWGKKDNSAAAGLLVAVNHCKHFCI